ncbi:involucrin-like isoform X2 [Corythoichthys intestinalis]|uniref:involucrin-like isoform X2 n=1 Tax=Corythoichthys intestinalis TaxID=161448 RepID=UPI0025A5E025|nr:involucrin-like isoform X2 [Corythoichthys intestinalis]XP_057685112.1 involucrin-like isoform X2 [Corythoichthys intestinalis]XP_057685113.1 involucrin-like isoform X2 [Corythoichthys intestinalis]XP_057685114.1 involucrin-like isoform X2 [Corythoichthys intestinalis]XP_057685115.1 involucrin-like isoform X2 [Corythoichthys intestinalis]XP_057685116.1 involucrin-like isoform X2 [Corythoichthys intestinalis]XP_057685117.1 involucrin-like isoform X2 [Corythoichthys intestinalis]XP_05768511
MDAKTTPAAEKFPEELYGFEVVFHRREDASQAHCPERQESARIGEEEEEESQFIKKEEEEFVHIKDEWDEYFIRVENPYIEEQQQPNVLKMEEDPPYVKVEVVDIPKWSGEPLKCCGPSEANREAEPPSGSSSSSTERSEADILFAQPSDSDDATSHSLFCFRKSLGPQQQESESPGMKEEVEHLQRKQEQPEHLQQQKREAQLPITNEEEKLPLYVKEEHEFTTLTGDCFCCGVYSG